MLYMIGVGNKTISLEVLWVAQFTKKQNFPFIMIRVVKYSDYAVQL